MKKPQNFIATLEMKIIKDHLVLKSRESGKHVSPCKLSNVAYGEIGRAVMSLFRSSLEAEKTEEEVQFRRPKNQTKLVWMHEAAKALGMHHQTLRRFMFKHNIKPKRSPGGYRLVDVEFLRMKLEEAEKN